VNTLPEVIADILRTLRTDLGDFDLSGSDRVKLGTFNQPPPTGAFICLTPPALTESVPYGRMTDFFLETYEATLRCFSTVAKSTADERAERGRRLAAEAVAALEVAHLTSGTYPNNGLRRCVRFRASADAPNPAADNATPGPGYVAVNLEFTFRRAPGTGA
jgi:hypothetical protein